jgi:DNA-binding MarR family transcriptional regulator
VIVGSGERMVVVTLDRDFKLTSEGAQGLDDASPERLVLALRDASRGLQRLLIAQTRSSGLGLFEYLVLSRVGDGDGVIPGDVGRLLGLSSSTMTGVSNRLEAEKLVRRYPHPRDGRLVLLKTTAKGRRVRQRALGPLWPEVFAETTRLDPHDQAAVIHFVEQLVALLNPDRAVRLAPPGFGGAESSGWAGILGVASSLIPGLEVSP